MDMDRVTWVCAHVTLPGLVKAVSKSTAASLIALIMEIVQMVCKNIYCSFNRHFIMNVVFTIGVCQCAAGWKGDFCNQSRCFWLCVCVCVCKKH